MEEIKQGSSIAPEKIRGGGNRNTAVDLIRGIGILIMIIDHVGFGHGFYKWSHAFHMPLFFLVSGYFFSEKKATESPLRYIGKKAKALLIPYFVWSMVCYAAWMLLVRDEPWYTPLTHIFWKSQSGIPVAEAIWFLICLFAAETLFILLVWFTKKKMWLSLAACVVLSLAAYIVVRLWGIELPWCLIPAVMALPFLWMGWRFAHLRESVKTKITNLPIVGVIGIAALATGLIILNSTVNMRTGRYGYYLLFYINAALVTLVLWMLANRLKRIEHWWGHRAVAYVGRMSLIYLCVNQVVILIVSRVLARVMPVDRIWSKLIISVFVIGLCSCAALAWEFITRLIKKRKQDKENMSTTV